MGINLRKFIMAQEGYGPYEGLGRAAHRALERLADHVGEFCEPFTGSTGDTPAKTLPQIHPSRYGFPLPIYELADELHVKRNAVHAALRTLRARGLVETGGEPPRGAKPGDASSEWVRIVRPTEAARALRLARRTGILALIEEGASAQAAASMLDAAIEAWRRLHAPSRYGKRCGTCTVAAGLTVHHPRGPQDRLMTDARIPDDSIATSMTAIVATVVGKPVPMPLGTPAPPAGMGIEVWGNEPAIPRPPLTTDAVRKAFEIEYTGLGCGQPKAVAKALVEGLLGLGWELEAVRDLALDPERRQFWPDADTAAHVDAEHLALLASTAEETAARVEASGYELLPNAQIVPVGDARAGIRAMLAGAIVPQPRAPWDETAGHAPASFSQAL